MITLPELKALLHYSPDTGDFVSAVNRGKLRAGEKVGTTLPNGYVHIMIRRKFYKGHRLAWFYMTGEWPSEQVDHINRNRSDNRFANLRQCSGSQNCANKKRYANNTTSVTGVYWHKKSQRWTASIDVERRRINLGYFDSVESAAVVRRAAEMKYFGEFARAA